MSSSVVANHDPQDGIDAAARARAGYRSRPRPIRYDRDTWLVMRNDPVLPAATIQRLRGPSGREFFIAVRWDLDTERRVMIGRYGTLQEADAAVLYERTVRVVADPREDLEALRQRQEQQAAELERQQAERAKLYGS
jgi:hypothetical protein